MTGPSRVLSPLALFLAFSDGWTFAFRSIAAAMPGSVWDAPGRAWFLVGGAGILLAGLVTAAASEGRAGLAELLRRTVDPRRAGAAAWAVALAWWSWHVPLHLLPGYFAPFAHPPGLWGQLAGIAVSSVLLTWLYLNTRRSVLIAVVFHWMGNLTGEVLQPSPLVDAVQLALAAAAALLVVALGFPRFARR